MRSSSGSADRRRTPRCGSGSTSRWGRHGVGWTTSDLPTVHHHGKIAEQYDGVVYVNRVGPTHPTANARAAIARRERY